MIPRYTTTRTGWTQTTAGSLPFRFRMKKRTGPTRIRYPATRPTMNGSPTSREGSLSTRSSPGRMGSPARSKKPTLDAARRKAKPRIRPQTPWRRSTFSLPTDSPQRWRHRDGRGRRTALRRGVLPGRPGGLPAGRPDLHGTSRGQGVEKRHLTWFRSLGGGEACPAVRPCGSDGVQNQRSEVVRVVRTGSMRAPPANSRAMAER